MNRQSKFSIVALTAAVVAVAGTALAQTRSPAATDDQIRAAFAAADVNKDKVIDIDEAVGDAILVFAALDTNRDGFLVVAELKNYDPERLKRADRDGDGKLSVGEVAADRVYEFFIVDTDRNGAVTVQELLIYAAKVRGERK